MNDELATLMNKARVLTDEVRRAFGTLTPEQLNWKPAADAWSVAQCLEHLIITNEKEFPAIEQTLREDYRNPFWSRPPLLPKLFGRLMINLFGPENARRYKAPKSFRPSQSRIGETIVEDFAAHQAEFVRLFEQTARLDPEKTMVVSPVTDFITYSLLDCCRILVGHERRHFRQAVRVTQTAGFPR